MVNDSERPEALRAYAARAVAHTHWPDDPREGLSEACRAELRDELTKHVTSTIADSTIAAIDAHVVDYRIWRRHTDTPPGRTFRRWCESAVTRLNEFETWLQGAPLPKYSDQSRTSEDRLGQDRQLLLREIDAFRASIQWAHVADRRPGRKPDWQRADLVGCCGTALALAGVPIAVSRDGAFARVLTQVLHNVGLPSLSDTVITDIRNAANEHPEWPRARRGRRRIGKE